MQDGFEIHQIRCSWDPNLLEPEKQASGKLGNVDLWGNPFELLYALLSWDGLGWDEWRRVGMRRDELRREELKDQHLHPPAAFLLRQQAAASRRCTLERIFCVGDVSVPDGRGELG